MEIKRLISGDEEVACDVAELFKSQHSSYDKMTALLGDDSNYFFVALEDGEPLGFVLGYELPRLDRDRAMMFLYEIEVLQQHRMRGIGHALIDSLLEICRENGVMKLFVLTDLTNIAAHRLYESTGALRIFPDQALFCYQINTTR